MHNLKTELPNCLDDSGWPLRWHVRAYCEKNRAFRDFVLSRFRRINGLEGDADFTKADDKRWNNKIDIVLVPDSRLTDY
ncbi:transcriptional regulator [Alishewanella jeotgali]|uniref:Transcriptional regulator n=1 Tax=Alishewanella jeotgali KCTC 22429 TaxID=1129374 RepID=H3Z9Q1_9ALTE|nr:transcriptional regulator [Alishewanella jeotgali]EHR42575.1 transcriptional regulator [Alishewanella jeotgali KCTC 22429]